MYVCSMCLSASVHMYTYVRSYVGTHVCFHNVCVPICVRTYVYACVHVSECVNTQSYLRTCMLCM